MPRAICTARPSMAAMAAAILATLAAGRFSRSNLSQTHSGRAAQTIAQGAPLFPVLCEMVGSGSPDNRPYFHSGGCPVQAPLGRGLPRLEPNPNEGSPNSAYRTEPPMDSPANPA